MRISAICAALAIWSLIGAMGARADDGPGQAGPDVGPAAPFMPGGTEGTFLAISDLHFDPYADPAIVRHLLEAPVEEWPAIFGVSSAAFSQYGRDTNYRLLISALDAAKDLGLTYDYVLVTGDQLAHRFKAGFDRHAG